MKLQFNIRQLLILSMNAAILLAIAKAISNLDTPYSTIAISMLVPVFPFSFGFLISVFDRPSARRKELGEAIAGSSFLVFFAWGIWLFYFHFDKQARKSLVFAQWHIHLLSSFGSVLYLLRFLSIRERVAGWLKGRTFKNR